MQVKIVDTNLFQFTQPKFNLGQQVETWDGLTGYVVGLDFYPETLTWSYGIYVTGGNERLIEEIWYDAEQLSALDRSLNLPKNENYRLNPLFNKVAENLTRGTSEALSEA